MHAFTFACLTCQLIGLSVVADGDRPDLQLLLTGGRRLDSGAEGQVLR